MKKPNDTWLRVFFISALTALSIVSHWFDQQEQPETLLPRILLSFLAIVLIWHADRAIIYYFYDRYPARHQNPLRVLLTFISGILATTLLLWFMALLRHLVHTGTLTGFVSRDLSARLVINDLQITINPFGLDFLHATFNFFLLWVIYQAAFFSFNTRQYQKQLKQAELEKEALKAANLHSQLEALKQQVNPHFLFNSLNSLSTLIDEDPQQANRFLDELSSVYRYLLRSNEQTLTKLSTELEFVQSYYHLLKTRHGSGLQLALEVDARYQDYHLPPLTLQLLVENAVKHNVILPDQPLLIEIRTNDQAQLVVQNSLQRKTVRVLSNGVGLSNILTKYRMLDQIVPTVEEANGQFVVTLPLIK